MHPKILLFDFDGTIADTAELGIQTYNAIARENGYTLISKENLPALRSLSAIENIRLLAVPLWKLPAISKKVWDAFKDEIPHMKAVDGIQDSLRILKEKGCTLHIISSNSKDNIQRFLSHNHITEFDDVHSVLNIFGKDTKILALIHEHGWDPSLVTYIGDEVRDIEAAKKAGVKAVAVSWGYNSHEALEKSAPDRLLLHPKELGSL